MHMDPTIYGLAIAVDAQPKYRDMFDFVLHEWRKTQPADADVNAVMRFIDTARELFSKNQPIAQDFMGSLLSLRFQDGKVLTVCDAPVENIPGGDTGAMHVAATHPGKGKIVMTPSWGVTGS